MKIYRVTIERYEPTTLGPVVSSYVAPKIVVSEEFYQSEESATKRVDEISNAQKVIGYNAVTASWSVREVKP